MDVLGLEISSQGQIELLTGERQGNEASIKHPKRGARRINDCVRLGPEVRCSDQLIISLLGNDLANIASAKSSFYLERQLAAHIP